MSEYSIRAASLWADSGNEDLKLVAISSIFLSLTALYSSMLKALQWSA